MILLSIDTSCDDTALSILEKQRDNIKILFNFTLSQAKLHRSFGGVYPSLAKREHKKNLPLIFKNALKEAKILESDINKIAVTTGPGLSPCLWQGINFARSLKKDKYIVPINHIEAHILINLVQINGDKLYLLEQDKIFPAAALVVSGGHTEIIEVKKTGKYKEMGSTRDDAAGECFDKTARILGLPYPGGPEIEKLAKEAKSGDRKKFKIELPRPMIKSKNFDFSFSGLKTAVLYDWQKRSQKEKSSPRFKKAFAKEIQESVVDVLTEKTEKALAKKGSKSLLIGGGVAANNYFREKIKKEVKKEFPKISVLIPPKELCSDNALMIGVAAILSGLKKGKAEAFPN